MRRAKLKRHTNASGNLCARRSRNGWHKISGASACRCRSCWPTPNYGTQRWLLGLEDFLKHALHIVDDVQVQSERERTLDYISGVEGLGAIVTRVIRVLYIIEALKGSDWMIFVWKIPNH